MDMTQYILVVGGVIVLSLLIQFGSMFMHSMYKKKFENDNPDSSIMVLKDRPFHPLGFTNTLTCLSINGEAREQIMTGYGQRGHYLLPGNNVLELQYETQRPGILHKWVRTTYEPQKIEVNVEPNKKYAVSYNKKSDSFEFEEIS